MTQPRYPAVATDTHWHFLCRCGEPVALSIWGVDVRTCRCGRRLSWDGETIGVSRPEGGQKT